MSSNERRVFPLFPKLCPKLTPAEREAKREAHRAKVAARGGGFFTELARMVEHLVDAAELMFPQSGAGSERRDWVVDAIVASVKTPLGDPIEHAILDFLIGLVLDRRDDDEIDAWGRPG